MVPQDLLLSDTVKLFNDMGLFQEQAKRYLLGRYFGSLVEKYPNGR